MKLSEAITLHTQQAGKTDILELVPIEIRQDFLSEQYYSEIIDTLPKGDYFLSDLDGTFFRGMLSQETFSLFSKYIKKRNLLSYDLHELNRFLEDNKYFDILEKQAYNKEIDFKLYINAGTFLLFKHKNLINWKKFLIYLENNFEKKEKINPYRFSFQKMKDVLLAGHNFLFISGAPSFALEIYLEGVKRYVSREIGSQYAEKIFAVGSLVDTRKDYSIPLFGPQHKKSFIDLLREKNIIINTVGGMGDTASDYGLSQGLDNGNDFYFMNPEEGVFKKYDSLYNPSINYHFLIERKDLILELDREKIGIVNLNK
ncbi:hypothetical protein MK079_03750 [Candidatus Gracilibacteria bacterium]|nr:hypothetical protein [Candidatus Gracilibacteria bacterium]